jgi:hypothetical protein
MLDDRQAGEEFLDCGAFGDFLVMLWQLSWLTDRTPEADRYERE